ncbi:MAG: hypothetical protein K6B75_02290, partial [Lachnospiraceae bacterium]|nr:hypothetical protein [Lachnospiraceae bacterium]
MGIYAFIPGILIGCYAVLLFCMLGIKVSHIRTEFMRALIVHILWAAGSLFMRLNVAPGLYFWFNVSMIGLLLMPVSLVRFAEEFTGVRHVATYVFLGLNLTLIVINLLTKNAIMVPPVPTKTEVGTVYLYTGLSWLVFIPYILCIVEVGFLAYVLIEGVKKELVNMFECFFLTGGTAILYIGAALMVLPFAKGFPADMVAGIADAVCMYALVGLNKRVRRNRTIRKGAH